ncbi:hypothetical protein F4553_003366 [Allocatelliglobosispora scoriae]|uniref:Thioredoxin domain-containing protein n=1 Tax=Allocatelliglobosispora scoriae TaxID=643052 RepID=A0A841BLM5_9ACTN|nr:redoxin domain-containing protein [Allocatelliglobosispora scoriae]MBB5869987.1 hypothetical protein [Allocatelliglobosispora scoriae]
MPYLIAAVVLVGLLGLLNLVLSAGIIRRLREHTELLSVRLDVANVFTRAVGDRITPATATATDGTTVAIGSADALVLGFFTTDCETCHERLPEFVAYAKDFPPGRDGITAVVVGAPEEVWEMVDRLEPVARVIVEPEFGAVQTAVGVRGFPALCLIGPDGTIVTAGVRISSLPVGAAA